MADTGPFRREIVVIPETEPVRPAPADPTPTQQPAEQPEKEPVKR